MTDTEATLNQIDVCIAALRAVQDNVRKTDFSTSYSIESLFAPMVEHRKTFDAVRKALATNYAVGFDARYFDKMDLLPQNSGRSYASSQNGVLPALDRFLAEIQPFINFLVACKETIHWSGFKLERCKWDPPSAHQLSSIENIYSLPLLQVRFVSIESVLVIPYLGGRGKGAVDLQEAIEAENKGFSFLRNLFEVARGKPTHSHIANVNFPSGPLLVLKDFLETGSSSRIEASVRYKVSKEKCLAIYVHLAMSLLVHAGVVRDEAAQDIFTTLTGLSPYHPNTFIYTSPFSHKPEEPTLADKSVREQYLWLVNDLENLMRKANNFFFTNTDDEVLGATVRMGSPGRSINVVLSYSDLRVNLDIDYPFQAALGSTRIKPRDILGFLLNEYSIEEKNEEFELVRQLFKENPLGLCMSTDHHFSFIPALKQAGAPKAVLHSLLASTGRSWNDLFSVHRESLKFIREYQLPKYAVLQDFARQFLAPFAAFYEAPNWQSGFVAYATQYGYTVWYMPDGSRLNP